MWLLHPICNHKHYTWQYTFCDTLQWEFITAASLKKFFAGLTIFLKQLTGSISEHEKENTLSNKMYHAHVPQIHNTTHSMPTTCILINYTWNCSNKEAYYYMWIPAFPGLQYCYHSLNFLQLTQIYITIKGKTYWSNKQKNTYVFRSTQTFLLFKFHKTNTLYNYITEQLCHKFIRKQWLTKKQKCYRDGTNLSRLNKLFVLHIWLRKQYVKSHIILYQHHSYRHVKEYSFLTKIVFSLERILKQTIFKFYQIVNQKEQNFNNTEKTMVRKQFTAIRIFRFSTKSRFYSHRNNAKLY